MSKNVSTETADSVETKHGVSRRDFVKTSSAVVAGSALISCKAVPRAYARGSDTIKVGVVGCGGRGTGAAGQALSADDGVVIWSMGDAFPDRLKRSKKNLVEHASDRVKVPAERSFTGFDAYKNVIDSGVDVVILATPPHFRPEHLAASVNAGKHVFCEKPMAVDGPGVRSVIDSVQKAKDNNTNLMSGFCWRYSLPERETYRRIHDGAIGDVQCVHTTYHTGTLGKQSRKPEWSDTEWQMRNWWHFNWLSGDHIVEQSCHSVDKINWAMQNQTPLRATGLGDVRLAKGQSQEMCLTTSRSFMSIPVGPDASILAGRCPVAQMTTLTISTAQKALAWSMGGRLNMLLLVKTSGATRARRPTCIRLNTMNS
jgi:myo-inositol 2-dehydrogenase/D-chiro-inositol 1-dehydrogenase